MCKLCVLKEIETEKYFYILMKQKNLYNKLGEKINYNKT